MKFVRNILCALALLLSTPLVHAEWLKLTNTGGTVIEAKIVSKTDHQVTLVRKSDKKRFTIKRTMLSIESREIVEDWESGVDEEETGEIELGDFSKRLYPNTLEEIAETIAEITARESSNSTIEKEQQRTVNQLNVFRYLCGVPYDVEADPEMVEAANDAALACERNGSLSHDLGHSTEKCNLSYMGDIFESLSNYIEDPGPKNRGHRGHRRWCLNPEMGKTGFGAGKNGFSGMFAHDHSGKKNRESWSYPGKGLFPHKYLLGNAWSLYLTEKAPEKDKLTVEVFKLERRPEKPILRNQEIVGKQLPVEWVSTDNNSINFEPESGTVGKGIYWVRAYGGGGVREGYLVELY